MSMDLLVLARPSDTYYLDQTLKVTLEVLEDKIGQMVIITEDVEDLSARHGDKGLKGIHPDGLVSLPEKWLSGPDGDFVRRLRRGLIVLKAFQYMPRERFLVLYGNCFLSNPQSLFQGEKTLFNIFPHVDEDARILNRQLLDPDWVFPLSFGSSYMVMEKRRLAALLHHVTEKSGMDWLNAICSVCMTEKLEFSPFDLYGLFCLFAYPDDFVLDHRPEASLPLTPNTMIVRQLTRMLNSYWSVRIIPPI